MGRSTNKVEEELEKRLVAMPRGRPRRITKGDKLLF